MRIHQFFKRQKSMAFAMGTGGVTGVRKSHVTHFFDTPVPPYKGPFRRHLIIFMNEGAGAFRRDGETMLVEAGETLLVQAGAGSLEFIASKTTKGFSAEIVEFDARSVARHLRQSFAAEREALEGRAFPPTGVKFHELQIRCFPIIPGIVHPQFNAEETFKTLFDYCVSQTAPLARAILFEERWELLRFLEAKVWMPLSDLTWQDTYAKGARRLVRDCRFFVGCTPAVFMKRRKIQLASAWLRCGRRVEEIALALGFSSAWEFQCLFGAFTKRRCATVAAETPLSLMSAYELHEAIAPFYWSYARPTHSVPQNQQVRDFVRQLAALERRNRLAEVKPMWRPEKRWERPFGETARKPSGYLSEMFSEGEGLRRDDDDPFLHYSAADMRRLAEDFMEMKTTAAELVVPLFKGAPVRRPMAA